MQTFFNLLLIGNIFLFFALLVIIGRRVKMLKLLEKAEDNGYVGCALDVLKVMRDSIVRAKEKDAKTIDVIEDVREFLDTKVADSTKRNKMDLSKLIKKY